MHELSICQGLIRQVEALCREHAAERVLRIEVGIGPLSGVEADLLESAYPIAAHGTRAENAELVLKKGQVRVFCSICQDEMDVPPNRLLCTGCGTWKTRLVSGDELMLLRVELQPQEESCHV